MKALIYSGFLVFIFAISFFSLASCKASSKITEKSGEVLWSENCSRCHYSPDPEDYNDAQWEVIVMHMRVRGGLTEVEAQKITKFLQDFNH